MLVFVSRPKHEREMFSEIKKERFHTVVRRAPPEVDTYICFFSMWVIKQQKH